MSPVLEQLWGRAQLPRCRAPWQPAPELQVLLFCPLKLMLSFQNEYQERSLEIGVSLASSERWLITDESQSQAVQMLKEEVPPFVLHHVAIPDQEEH